MTQINLHLVIPLERNLKSEDSPYYPKQIQVPLWATIFLFSEIIPEI